MKRLVLTLVIVLTTFALSSKESEKVAPTMDDSICISCPGGEEEGETFEYCGTVYLCSDGEYWELECNDE